MTTVRTPPGPNDPGVTGARSDGSAAFAATGALVFATVTVGLGSAVKGATRSVVWIMFELDFPAGTKFGAMSLSLRKVLTSGSGDVPIWIGFLAQDGTWEAGGEAGLAFEEYANVESIPHPATISDAAWLGSAASEAVTIQLADAANGERLIWGTNLPDINYESRQLLVDLQTSFDANEANRTSRGVPVAMALVPDGTENRIFSFDSVEATIVSRRPILTVKTRRVTIVK